MARTGNTGIVMRVGVMDGRADWSCVFLSFPDLFPS
jgi:hypothetical protein